MMPTPVGQVQNINLLYKYYKTQKTMLRLRSLFVKTDWFLHVWCNFEPGYTCRITVIFETLKDDSL